jgi:hypothetical protein
MSTTVSDDSSYSRGWLWFFGILLGMTVVGICLEIWFNERQRLKHEQVELARQVWEKHRPAEYEMSYTVQDRDQDPQSYLVRVRKDGSFRVSSSGDEGEQEEKLTAGEFPYLNMEELFARIDEQLTEDQKPDNPRVFTTATFNRYDGHVMRYVRSMRASRQRLEVNVQSIRSLEE